MRPIGALGWRNVQPAFRNAIAVDIDAPKTVSRTRRRIDVRNVMRRFLDDPQAGTHLLDATILSAIFIVVVGIGYLLYQGLARFSYLF
jgi:hypothetical protein